MKKRAPNLPSFYIYTIKKRTRDFKPFLKRKKKCLEIYLLTLYYAILMNMYPNPSQDICINIYSVDPFFSVPGTRFELVTRGFSVLCSTN